MNECDFWCPLSQGESGLNCEAARLRAQLEAAERVVEVARRLVVLGLHHAPLEEAIAKLDATLGVSDE